MLVLWCVGCERHVLGHWERQRELGIMDGVKI